MKGYCAKRWVIVQSGTRSELAEDNKYRIKGNLFEEEPYGWLLQHGQPYGRQTLSRIETEIEHAERLGERFQEVGLTYVMDPVGYYLYPDYRQNEQSVAMAKILGQQVPRFKETGAAIFEIKGDTRLDELLGHLDRMDWFTIWLGLAAFPEYKDIIVNLGRDTGYTMRQMHDAGITWGLETGNAHPGNFVVYADGNNIRVVPVDLNAAKTYSTGGWSLFRKSFPKEEAEQEVQSVKDVLRRKADISGNGFNVNRVSDIDGQVYGMGRDYTREWIIEGFDDGYYRSIPGDIGLDTMVGLDARLNQANETATKFMEWSGPLDRIYWNNGEVGEVIRHIAVRGLETGNSLEDSIKAAEEYGQRIVKERLFVI